MRKALVGLVFALLAEPAEAVLIVSDLAIPGDGLVLRDVAHGLEWLSLKATAPAYGHAARSYAEIEAGADGWIADGWRHASAGEVCGLISAASPGCPLQAFPDPFDPNVLNLATLGETDRYLTSLSQYRFGPLYLGIFAPSADPARPGVLQVWIGSEDSRTELPPIPRSEIIFDKAPAGGGWGVASALENYGHLLVRPLSAIPEPSTSLLVGGGFAVLSALRRFSLSRSPH